MPIGLGLVRVGNFLNGELYGRATSGNWGFIFPTDPLGLPRHPSQLYESFMEGIILFLILLLISKKTERTGIISASFLIFYGLIRFFIEFFRQPDAHLGFVALEWLSMGQLLCLPMIFAGFLLLNYFLRKT
jgi:phosphatidylglycerol:prolipoprotein diacylglycerol transferase